LLAEEVRDPAEADGIVTLETLERSMEHMRHVVQCAAVAAASAGGGSLAMSTLELDPVDPLEQQMAHFVEVLRGLAEPRVTARDGLQNLRVVEAVAAAARSGRVVEVSAARR
jgi:predicted dehydrogenase